MFEKSLVADLKKIFDISKVTFDQPSEDHEQEALFIKVDKVHPGMRDNKEVCRVNGTLLFYVNADKMPFGYFVKRIELAKQDANKFFFSPEQNSGQIGNIQERSMDFVYLFDDQYNPKPDLEGLVTDITFQGDS